MDKHLRFNKKCKLALLLLLSAVGMMKALAQPTGAINGLFSVSENTQVYFSQGNLQYQASTNTWRFAENQYNYIGSANTYISSTYSGWIDLFGWGTSGYNHGAVCYQPWSTSENNSDYYAYGSSYNNLNNQTGQADWGYNAISNGGNQTNQWRTLTKVEWAFLLNTRNTSSGIRFARAKVNNVNGIIILPDNWNSAYYTLNNTNNTNASYSSNTISLSSWDILETNGAVFLPAAGFRDGTYVYGVGSNGGYHTATYYNENGVYDLYIGSSYLLIEGTCPRSNAQSVRLVRSVPTYSIGASVIPSDGGTVTGMGNYAEGQLCTLTAIANSGYIFSNWTKNGEVVSTKAAYIFTVTESGNYVANFVTPTNEYFTIESLSDNNTITLSIPNEISSSELTSVSYSTDKTSWNTLTINSTYQTISVTLGIGDKVYFKGIGYQYGTYWYDEWDDDEYEHCSISASGNFQVYGNIMSLLYGDNFVNKTACGESYTFFGLFSGNTYLISAENLVLPATTLSNNCYRAMFSNCSSLTMAPALPATTLNYHCYECYMYMFSGCSSLTTAPALPATTLAGRCYKYMFNGCTSLTTAPELPAATLADYCYDHMFNGCTSLTTAPELPATTLEDYCYDYMFNGCTSLTTAPELPATSLANYCYDHMFFGCTSLTTAPALPATTLASCCYNCMFMGCTSLIAVPMLPATVLAYHCYSQMFSGCTSLIIASALPATTLAGRCYNYMFNGCTSLTTAPELPAATLADYCYDHMFNGCTSLTTAPELPATTLADHCYYYMFNGCTSLTTAPELPATTLANYCYYYMFGGCSSLTTAPELPATTLVNSCYREMFKNCSLIDEIVCLATNISAGNCTTNWLSGVASTGTFHKSPEMQDWPLNSPSGIPEGWTVIGNNYEIIATANPTEGGTVTGAGNYNENTVCTLTATPSEGYTFVNWIENGGVVSNDATYTFTVTESASYTANFIEASTANHWTTITGTQYNLTMSGVIYIDGIAQTSTALEVGAFCGNECRGSARAQFFPPTGDYVVSLTVVSNEVSGETITFRLFDHRIQQEYPNGCVNSITFNANDNYGAMGNWYEFSFMTPTIPQTFTLPIDGYGEGAGGYYLIAPLVTEVSPSTENGFFTEEYDLYYFDQSQELEWQNYKINPFNLVSGKGYLYASKTNTTLAFIGEPYIGNGNVTLNYTEGANFSGWNLVGNPYDVTAYIDRDFYIMREDGAEIIPGNGNAIAPMQGIFVIAVRDGEEMTFSTNAPTNNGSKVVVNVRRKHGDVIDRVMVRFDGGAMLPKHMLHPENTKLYIAESEKEYAVVCNSGKNITPVCFCAAENGTYTLNVEVDNIEMEYLHLIDNITGADIDLLQMLEYTFQARTTDNASRFQLIFANTSEHDE